MIKFEYQSVVALRSNSLSGRVPLFRRFRAFAALVFYFGLYLVRLQIPSYIISVSLPRDDYYV